MKARQIIEAHFTPGVIARCDAFGIRVIELAKGQRYMAASGVLSRMAVDVDAWPAPPAGLFVVEERAVYVRSVSPMTVVHEYGHAIDCMLGDGTYASSKDQALRAEYASAQRFVTPYAATATDEWFAEGVRSYAGANDEHSWWPIATRERLIACAPVLHDYLAGALA